MTKILRWGILGTARVARNRMIPALIEADRCDPIAIASRNLATARDVADVFGIDRVYGSYEALIADPDVDAIYIPLPNSLHYRWTEAAMRAGKHVLCEKPIACNATEALRLLELSRSSGCRVQEGLMIYGHPQWQAVRELLKSGRLGRICNIYSHFSFYNVDPANIRNSAALGGGGLLDIGCYSISLSNWLVGKPPQRVMAALDRDAEFEIDRAGTVTLDYGDVRASFFYSTQSVYRQYLEIIGTDARLEIELPFSPPPDRRCRLSIFDGSELGQGLQEVIAIPPCNQFAATATSFATAILDRTDLLLSLDRSIESMQTIEAIFRADRTNTWTELTKYSQ
jgi:predicted dehydrogenase